MVFPDRQDVVPSVSMLPPAEAQGPSEERNMAGQGLVP